MIRSENKYYIANRSLVIKRAKQRWIDKKEEIKAKKLEYRRSIPGYLNKTYDNMLGRVRGMTKDAVYYLGLPLMSKLDFLSWSIADEGFNRTHKEWVDSGYTRKLIETTDGGGLYQSYLLY